MKEYTMPELKIARFDTTDITMSALPASSYEFKQEADHTSTAADYSSYQQWLSENS